MSKVIYIKDCKGCPFVSERFNRKSMFFCHKMSLQTDDGIVPVWCPLENASQPGVEAGAAGVCNYVGTCPQKTGIECCGRCNFYSPPA